jgi:hypothetical protein
VRDWGIIWYGNAAAFAVISLARVSLARAKKRKTNKQLFVSTLFFLLNSRIECPRQPSRWDQIDQKQKKDIMLQVLALLVCLPQAGFMNAFDFSLAIIQFFTKGTQNIGIDRIDVIPEIVTGWTRNKRWSGKGVILQMGGGRVFPAKRFEGRCSAKRLERLVRQRRSDGPSVAHGTRNVPIVSDPAPTHIRRIGAKGANVDGRHCSFCNVDAPTMDVHFT